MDLTEPRDVVEDQVLWGRMTVAGIQQIDGGELASYLDAAYNSAF